MLNEKILEAEKAPVAIKDAEIKENVAVENVIVKEVETSTKVANKSTVVKKSATTKPVIKSPNKEKKATNINQNTNKANNSQQKKPYARTNQNQNNGFNATKRAGKIEVEMKAAVALLKPADDVQASKIINLHKVVEYVRDEDNQHDLLRVVHTTKIGTTKMLKAINKGENLLSRALKYSTKLINDAKSHKNNEVVANTSALNEEFLLFAVMIDKVIEKADNNINKYTPGSIMKNVLDTMDLEELKDYLEKRESGHKIEIKSENLKSA